MHVGTLCIEAFVYPTEDEEKVLKALEYLIDAKPSRTEASLGFGGKITILRVCTNDAEQIDSILKRLGGIVNLEGCVDRDGNLDFSLDKQRAFLGQLALGKGIKVKSRKSR
ncbi:MAG: hypothetical protein J7L23_02050 [Candidatus Diapherotrites archaeon]|nr:hypothetical protein [Candidatus Diapherotrites archaeon]